MGALGEVEGFGLYPLGSGFRCSCLGLMGFGLYAFGMCPRVRGHDTSSGENIFSV